jgi:hypothetical protein
LVGLAASNANLVGASEAGLAFAFRATRPIFRAAGDAAIIPAEQIAGANPVTARFIYPAASFVAPALLAI